MYIGAVLYVMLAILKLMSLAAGIFHAAAAIRPPDATVKKILVALSLVSSCYALAAPDVHGRAPALSDQQVKKQIIADSIDAYPGKCPCPYNAARNGSACGGRSAWSRKGGYAPICYEREIDNDRVRKWRQEQGGAALAIR